MIDHTGVSVRDFEKSKTFYTKALSAIGYALLMELPAAVTGYTDVAGFGEPPKPDFWISGAYPINRRSTWRFASTIAPRSMRSIKRPWQRAAAIMVHRVCARIITSIITRPMCWIRMGTILRRCVISRFSAALDMNYGGT